MRHLLASHTFLGLLLRSNFSKSPCAAKRCSTSGLIITSPEVTHTPQGSTIIKNFAVNICGAKQEWTMEDFKKQEIERIQTLVGPTGQVIGAVSGGVDSSVAAKLMHEAIGERFHAVMVDNGVLREGEAKIVHDTLTKQLGVKLTVVDASHRFLEALKGISDPEKKVFDFTHSFFAP